MPIISRASNPIFIGAPLCQSLPLFDMHKTFNNYGTGRNPGFMDLNINFTFALIKAGGILRCFPPFLRP